MDVFLFSFWLHETSREAAGKHILSEFDRVVQPLSNGHALTRIILIAESKISAKPISAAILPACSKSKRAYDPDEFFHLSSGPGQRMAMR